MAELKIAWVRKKTKAHTGPASYLENLQKALKGKVAGEVLETIPKDGYDLVHIIDLKQIRLTELVSSLPIIGDLHDYYWATYKFFPSPDFFLRWILQKYRKPRYQKLIQACDGIIVHSPAVASYVQHQKIFMVRLGIDFEKFYALPENPREPLILLVGRDAWRKGLYPLIRALAWLKKNFPELKAEVIGEEYLHSKIFARLLIRNLPLNFSTQLAPSELVKKYQQALIVYLGSWQEGFGLSLIEGISAGCCAIGSRAGGIVEIIQDKQTGLLFEPGDYQELAEKIARVVENPELRIQLVKEGQKLVRENFSLSQLAQDLLNAYQEVLRVAQS